ncbi:MAG: methyltransferase domain-containing protein [Geodermatophilaceae bacterium]|nr:methyltransferase domain-containing protein [Geodermatophilaceae bacterium]
MSSRDRADEQDQADADAHTQRLASASLAANDPAGRFEPLYAAARLGAAVVPWDRGEPHRLLVQWVQARAPKADGRRALVVGCGLGDDAEYVFRLGFETVAFDVADSAVYAARQRFPASRVDYLSADLLSPPHSWRHAFDLVVEILTVQSLPRTVRQRATANVGLQVAAGGTLVVVASALADHDDPRHGPPWPLTRAEIEAFASDGLEPVSVEDVHTVDRPGAGRWLAEFRRPQSGNSPQGVH